jgi:hypothetical protein
MKFFQYFSKILLWRYIDSKRHPQAHQRASTLSKTFSTTRKLIRLAHCVYPYNELRELIEDGGLSAGTLSKHVATIYKSGPVPSPFTFLPLIQPINMALSIVNDIADDIICLAKIGVLEKSHVARFEPVSEKLWFTCICFDLLEAFSNLKSLRAKLHSQRSVMRKTIALDGIVSLEDKKKLAELEQKHFIQLVSIVKLLCDMTFCGYDVFKSKRSEGIQHMSGFISGILALYKLWVKARG